MTDRINNLPQSDPEKQYILVTCNVCGGSGEVDCRRCDGDGYVVNSWGDRTFCDCDNGQAECFHCKGTGQLEEPVGASGGGTGEPSDERDGAATLDALPTDLSTYATMSRNDLRECHYQLPALLNRGTITPDEYEARLKVVEIAEHMRRYESRIAEMQDALEWERKRLVALLPAPAQPSASYVTALTRTYLPGTDGQYHIADDNGGTLCGTPVIGEWPPKPHTCQKCEELNIALLTPPAAPVGDLDDLTRAEMKADVTPPAAAPATGGTKLSGVMRGILTVLARGGYIRPRTDANGWTLWDDDGSFYSHQRTRNFEAALKRGYIGRFGDGWTITDAGRAALGGAS